MDFETLYREYFEDVYRYLRSLSWDEALSEELTQETFFKAMRSLNRFRGDCDVRVWLCQIAKNCWYSHLRREKRRAKDALSQEEASEERLESLLDDRELAFRLHRILHRLDEPYKEVFSLRVFGELDFTSIGLLFGKSAHWACVTYHRAKEKIQKEMEAEE